MRRPIWIAMLISVALHAALLLVVFPKHEPPKPPPPLEVQLKPSDAGVPAAVPASNSAVSENTVPQSPVPAEEAPPPAEPPVDDRPAASESPVRVADVPGVEPGATSEPIKESPLPPAEPEPALTEARETVGDAEKQAVVSVTTAPPSIAQTAPMTQRQRKMLERKIRDWAETYHHKIGNDGELQWKHKGQEYTARFARDPAEDEMALDRVSIDISTNIDGERVSTSLSMKRLAFSNYAQFVNRWDRSVQLHDDELDGRFHSNSAINLAYSRKAKPRFLGKVTTSARRINVTEQRGRMRRDQVFIGGLQTGVRSIRLPKNFVPLPDAATLREDQVQTFTADARITFQPDGSYTWIPLEGSLFERRGSLRAPATYLIAADGVTLEVRGTVDGKVLIYSPERIDIIGDLVYAEDPESIPATDDFIGLVSEKNVEIAAPAVTGTGDLHITAAIYAKRRFKVDRYRSKRAGVLSIFGSLTAGSLSATEPRFATRIRFDPRLESRRPPGFPVTDRYEVESWDAAWTVAPDLADVPDSDLSL